MSIDADALRIIEAALDIDATDARDRFIAASASDPALLARIRHLMVLDNAALPATDALTRMISPELPVPERLGPFRIVGEIGRGGMGAVYRGERDDGRFAQSVAIKLIRHPAAEARFAEERRMLGRLDHPGIVRIIDGGEADGLAWLAMELVTGETLDVAARSLPVERALALFGEVAAAVAHAHRQLIVHADIKPSNVMVDAQGAVRLLDFGIARLLLDDAGGEGPYPLTRQFAAPERIAGAMPTIAGDVYSLGALLKAMLGDRTMGALGADCAAIIAKAKADDPADRYPDVARLADDVAHARAMRPVEARAREGRRYRLACFARRNRRAVIGGTLAAVLLLGAGGISLAQYFRAARADAEAAARFGDARATARYLLDTLLPRLESQPGALPLRAEIATFAQGELDHLASAGINRSEVRLEAATGLWRLAALQAGSNGPNLGQTAPADANLRRAEAIAAGVPGDAARLLLARVLIDRVRLATTMHADLPAAEALATRMQARVAEVEALDPALAARADAVLSDMKGWEGDFEGERRLAQQAIALGRRSGSLDPLTLAALNDRLAEADFYQDHLADALSNYRAALGFAEAALARQPGSMFAHARRMEERWNIGTTLMQMARAREAMPILAQGTDEARMVLAFDPADREARRNLRVISAAYAQALSLNGRQAPAMAILNDLLQQDQARLAREPGEARLERDVVYDRMVIGETLDRGGNRTGACALDRATLDAIRGLQRRGHLTGLDAANNLRLLNARMVRDCR